MRGTVLASSTTPSTSQNSTPVKRSEIPTAVPSPSMSRRGLFAALGAALTVVTAEPALAENSSILASLESLKQGNAIEFSRAVRIKKARDQLVRVEYLAAASDYMAAREQLRLGALSGIRMDVRAFTNELDGMEEKTELELKAALEKLDTALRQRRSPEICREKAEAVRKVVEDLLLQLKIDFTEEERRTEAALAKILNEGVAPVEVDMEVMEGELGSQPVGGEEPAPLEL